MLTAQSTIGEILENHPKRMHFNDIVFDPDQTWFGHAGPWAGVLEAQDKVILRRHTRQFFPDVARIWKIEELEFPQLCALVNAARIPA